MTLYKLVLQFLSLELLVKCITVFLWKEALFSEVLQVSRILGLPRQEHLPEPFALLHKTLVFDHELIIDDFHIVDGLLFPLTKLVKLALKLVYLVLQFEN